MRYAGIIKNDVTAGEGVCVSFFTQGCPHHCAGCHNPETWAFDGGKEFTWETLSELIRDINANDIQRNFCVMGGEPLCPENQFLTQLVISTIKEKYPDIKVYIWTGYLYEDLIKQKNPKIDYILNNIDYLIDGPFILEQRDITLKMRGSKNQRIFNMKELRDIWKKEDLIMQEQPQT